MTLLDLQRLADLHYECYDAMITLRLFKNLPYISEQTLETHVERYKSAQREIVKITNKYGSDLSIKAVEVPEGSYSNVA